MLGLYDSLEEMFGGRPLPIMVQAVLLPFKGNIVYDGLLRSYAVQFGGGIKSNLHEEYMTAKQNKGIVTTLDPERQKRGEPKTERLPAVEEMVKATESMRGGPVMGSRAMSFWERVPGWLRLP